MQELQSEHPRVAKKAEETKIQAKPVQKQGWAMAVPKKEDERIAARLGKEEEEGEGSGVFSEFLHQWAVNVSQAYQPPPMTDDGCKPIFDVSYLNGHVTDIEPVEACSPELDQAFRAAIEAAPRPPMPTSFGGRQIPIRFYDTGHRRG